MNTLVVKIVWAALTLSQLMYAAVLFIVPGSGNPGPTLPLWIPAIVAGLVSLFIFTTRLSYLNLTTLFARSEPAQAAPKAFVFYIVCWALNESLAMFGFVLAFTSTHQLGDFLPYLGAGLILNVIMFPKLDLHVREAEARRAAGQA